MEDKIQENLKMFFSLITGDIFLICCDEIDNLDKHNLPLFKRPSSNCKKCYGRGFIGHDIKKNYYVPCKCLWKCLDMTKAPGFVDVENIKQVD